MPRVVYGSEEDLVVSRLNDSAQALERMRQKTYSLRRLVAGDTSLFGGMAASQEEDPGYKSVSDLYDFIIESVEDGRSNGLLEGVKILMMQVAYHFPQVEFEDLEPVQAAINAGACKVLLGAPPQGCSALDEMRQVLLDYLISGIGWSEVAFDPYTENPIVRAVDSLDVSWDTSKRLPTRARWVSQRIRQPLGYWIEHFGTEKLRKITGDSADIKGRDFDRPTELEFYYDLDGSKGRGSHYVFRRTERRTVDPTVIYKSENPFFYEFQSGVKRPFLPLTPMYFLRLPSTRNAVSVVEFMLPDQISIWRDEEQMSKVVERMAPFTMAEKGAFTKEGLEVWKRGDVNELVEIDSGKQAPQIVQGGEIPHSVLEDRDYHERRRTAMSGVNPYASGAPVEGTSYAAEVEQIQQSAGLTSGNVSADHTRLWIDTIRKFLGCLAVYGDRPIMIRYDNVDMEYGPDKPIKDRIVPDAEIAIREDSTIYRSRQQRMAEAMQDLKIFMALPQFPNALPKAVEAYLVAKGEQNIQAWLEPGVQDPNTAGVQGVQGPPGQQGQPGQTPKTVPMDTQQPSEMAGAATGG
jgi:hypothetical protein